jgi:pilus assembly protein CpaC
MMAVMKVPTQRLGSRGLFAAVVALACLVPVLARANGTGIARAVSAPAVHVGGSEHAVSRQLDLSIGKSVIIDLPRDAKEVFVANPKIANAVVRSTRKIFVIGMENGATSIFVMDADGRQIVGLEVTVGRDLATLKSTLRTALPTAQVDVRPAGDSILLTGVVSSAAEAQQAVDIANAFVGVSGGLFGGTKGAVVNSLTIKGRDQVMLRVTVAEVSRNVLKQLGVDINGSWSAIDFSSVNPFPLQRQILSSTLIAGDKNVAGTLNSGNFGASATQIGRAHV